MAKIQILFAGPVTTNPVAVALKSDYSVTCTNSPYAARQFLQKNHYDILILEPAGFHEVPDSDLYYYSVAKFGGLIKPEMGVIYYTRVPADIFKLRDSLYYEGKVAIECYEERVSVSVFTDKNFKKNVAAEKDKLRVLIEKFMLAKKC